MRIRAVIFDIYKTLLQVQPPPEDAEARWGALCASVLGTPPRQDLNRFAKACEVVIAREHATAHRAGIRFPEIYWPDVVVEVLPELGRLKPKQLEMFLVAHAGLQRGVRLMPGAADVLRALGRWKARLGLVSNSQPYTLWELDGSLAGAGLKAKLFCRELSLLSFELGFSKPDPHVFRLLTARLRGLGITAAETLVVGDRLDNDIVPARAQGFQTWHLNAACGTETRTGDWSALATQLQSQF